MKIKKLIVVTLCLTTLYTNAQKLIPFQYQSEQKWNYQQTWGLVTADKKVVLPPTYYTIAPKVIEEPYMFLGSKIIELKTGKILWDSLECKNVDKIVGNIVSIRMPFRPNGYQPYGFKNLKTKKFITENGRLANVNGFVVTEGDGAEGVVDENGNEIIKKTKYQTINRYANGVFIATSDYDGYRYIYDVKGKKINTKSYDNIEVLGVKKQFLLTYTLIDKTKNIYELILINTIGKEVAQRFYCTKKEGDFIEVTENGFAVLKKDATLFKSKDCAEGSKILNKIVLNQEGKIIIDDNTITEIKETVSNLLLAKSGDLKTTTLYNFNGTPVFKTTAFLNIEVYGDNLFFATDAIDTKKYFINKKGEKLVNGAAFKQNDLIRYNNGTGFLIYKKEFNKLFFNTYNTKTGVSNYGEQIVLETGISVERITAAIGKYYLVNVADNNKKQYATYIYDITGKLVQKSENGLWMYADEFFIKYTLNSKGDKIYIGYYDNELNPYSIISK